MLGPLYQDAMNRLTQSQWNFDEDPTLGTGGLTTIDEVTKKKPKTLDDTEISLSVDHVEKTPADGLDHKHEEDDFPAKTPSLESKEEGDFVLSVAEVERRQVLERQLSAEKKAAKKQKRKQFV